MEDIQSYNFKVKSNIHDYDVNFINDFKDHLINNLIDGDYIIIDKKILNLYKDCLKVLDDFNYIAIESNENQKSYEGLIPIIDSLINNGFKKNHRLIAIGGGITQDVTSFIASTLYRGVNWVFYPTSLLAQGDSCIGSKTSINFRKFKNQIGGFYPPKIVYIYLNFIKSLDQSEIKSGMGEMLHYFIVSSLQDFLFYKKHYKDAFVNNESLVKIIARSLMIKKRYIEKDEFDQNIRQVFNYGHSFGHAIESLTNYKIPHGVAVSFGMDIANFVSYKLDYINYKTRKDILEVTSYIWKGYNLKEINVENLIFALKKDKKNVGDKLGLILNKGYGKIFKKLVDPDEKFKKILIEYFKSIKNE